MGHTHRYQFGIEKKNQVKSPSVWSRTPNLVRIRQSGRTGNRGVTWLPRSLTPTQKFWIAPRVSYTHTEIWDISPGLIAIQFQQPSLLSLAIQCHPTTHPSLQYKFSITIQLGNSQNQFSAPLFFSFFF